MPLVKQMFQALRSAERRKYLSAVRAYRRGSDQEHPDRERRDRTVNADGHGGERRGRRDEGGSGQHCSPATCQYPYVPLEAFPHMLSRRVTGLNRWHDVKTRPPQPKTQEKQLAACNTLARILVVWS